MVHAPKRKVLSPVNKAIALEIPVVVPVYKEEGNILEFVRRIPAILRQITDS